jgi:hypothetical protein
VAAGLEDDPVHRLIIALVILGFIAFAYQGIALSSREASVAAPPPATAPAGR